MVKIAEVAVPTQLSELGGFGYTYESDNSRHVHSQALHRVSYTSRPPTIRRQSLGSTSFHVVQGVGVCKRTLHEPFTNHCQLEVTTVLVHAVPLAQSRRIASTTLVPNIPGNDTVTLPFLKTGHHQLFQSLWLCNHRS
jgi:hypothetical protein